MITDTTSRTSEINDFTAGSIIRSIYDAIAMQLNVFYVLTSANIKDGIKQGMANGFQLTQRSGNTAFGQVLITFNSPLTSNTAVPQGTTFKCSNSSYAVSFSTIEPYYVPSGDSSAYLTVYCNVTGTDGNVPAGAIDLVSNFAGNIASVTNELDFISGTDAESDSDFQARVNNFVTAIGRSTKQSIEYAVRRVQNITGVYIDDTDTGMIKIYCHDANGNLEQTDYDNVVYAISNSNDEYIPAGIAWEVLPIEKVTVNLEIDIYVSDVSQLTTAMENNLTSVVTNYLNTLTVGKDVSLSTLNKLLMNSLPYLITDVDISIPTSSDYTTDLDAANTTLSSQQTDLNTVNASLTTAQSNISNLVSELVSYSDDYIITPAEKTELAAEIANVNSYYTSDTSLASKYSISYTSYAQAYNNYVQLVSTLTADLTTNTSVDRTSYTSTISTYYIQRVTVLNNIQSEINTEINTTKNSIMTINQEIFDQTKSNISISINEVARPGDDIEIYYYDTSDATSVANPDSTEQNTTLTPDNNPTADNAQADISILNQ